MFGLLVWLGVSIGFLFAGFRVFRNEPAEAVALTDAEVECIGELCSPHMALVEFTTGNGETVRTEAEVPASTEPGDTFTVYYRRSDPNSATTSGRVAQWAMLAIGIGGFVGAIWSARGRLSDDGPTGDDAHTKRKLP